MLKQRIITALVLVVLLGTALYVVPAALLWVVFAAIVAIAGWEWAGLMRWQQPMRLAYAGTIALLCLVLHVAVPQALVGLVVLASAFWLCVVPLWLRYRWPLSGGIRGTVVGVLLLLATWAALTQLQRQSSWLLLAAMALVWVADIAAYFAGRRFGRHKLAPNISPGKTWEGVYGAVIGVVIYGLALQQSDWGQQWPLPLAFALAMLIVMTGVSVIGDLFESMLKRQAGIKDSSRLLPGHGGVLDRIDSLMSTLPVAAVVAWIVSGGNG